MQIQKEFDRIFKLLFGGGKGTLELADPEICWRQVLLLQRSRLVRNCRI